MRCMLSVWFFPRYHSVHLHGHNFAILAEEFPEYDPITGKITSPNSNITCGSDVLCANPGWSDTPPTFNSIVQPVIKDTVVLPVRGYVVFQFKTLNPGFWIFHCHIDVHMMAGMAVVLKIAPDQFPDLPPGFPTCNNEFTDHKLTYKNNEIDVSFD
jgi:FtsP/CotA-like multicopper oxidase with cupredoxin domain